MKNNKTFIASAVAAVLALLCCATPVLVILLGAIGLSALIGYLDYVLIPALGVFTVMAIYTYNKSS